MAKNNPLLNRMFFAFFTCLFISEVIWLTNHIQAFLSAPPIIWALAGLASLRLGRTISYNGIAEWLRWPFVHEVEDTSGAGNNLEANPGLFNVIGQLITCPICSGTWSASFLVTVYCLNAQLGSAFIAILGIAGISEILHWMAEKHEWEGRAAREAAGSAWLLKNRGAEVNAYSVRETRPNISTHPVHQIIPAAAGRSPEAE